MSQDTFWRGARLREKTLKSLLKPLELDAAEQNAVFEALYQKVSYLKKPEKSPQTKPRHAREGEVASLGEKGIYKVMTDFNLGSSFRNLI